LTYEDDDEAFVEPSTGQQLEENEPISEMDDQ